MTTIVKAISASPAMMTKPRRDDRRESARRKGVLRASPKITSSRFLAPCAPIFMGHNRKRH